MTGVLGMSELLLASPLDPQQRGYTQSIRHAGEHLLHLVNDALDLAADRVRRLEQQSQSFALNGPAAGSGGADGPAGCTEGPALRPRQPAAAGPAGDR